MGASSKHHFIPAFYPQNWTNSSDKVIEYSVKHHKIIPKPVGPNATGFEFNLYAFSDLPPEMVQAIEEKFFQYADNMASIALTRLLNPDKQYPSSLEILTAWTRFVIVVDLRHPDTMPEIREGVKRIWEGITATHQPRYERTKRPGDPPTLTEYLEKLRPSRQGKNSDD